jgi:hypothetical protein
VEKIRRAGIIDATVVGKVVNNHPGKYLSIKEVELSVSFMLDP